MGILQGALILLHTMALLIEIAIFYQHVAAS